MASLHHSCQGYKGGIVVKWHIGRPTELLSSVNRAHLGGRDLGRKNTGELETWANKAGRGKERIWHEGTKTKQDTIRRLIC